VGIGKHATCMVRWNQNGPWITAEISGGKPPGITGTIYNSFDEACKALATDDTDNPSFQAVLLYSNWKSNRCPPVNASSQVRYRMPSACQTICDEDDEGNGGIRVNCMLVDEPTEAVHGKEDGEPTVQITRVPRRNISRDEDKSNFLKNVVPRWIGGDPEPLARSQSFRMLTVNAGGKLNPWSSSGKYISGNRLKTQRDLFMTAPLTSSWLWKRTWTRTRQEPSSITPASTHPESRQKRHQPAK